MEFKGDDYLKLWQSEDKNIKLIQGDCLEVMDKLIGKGIKIDAIITDPPYNIKYMGNEWDVGFEMPFDKLDTVLKDNGNIILFQGWSNVLDTLNKKPENWTLENWIIYDRIKGRGSKKNLVSTREDILWFSKGKERTFNAEEAISNIKKKTGGMGKKNGCEFRKLTNVWYDISPIVPWSKERTGHPTQKPLQLMERIVKLYTNENNIILDFTMGSGTTGVACANLGRKFIGIELEEKYFNIAIDRIKNALKS